MTGNAAAIILLASSTLWAQHTTPTIAVYMDYDARVPVREVLWAKSQTSKVFAKIGIPVEFRSGRTIPLVGASGLELDMYVGMQLPERGASNALGVAHPFRQDGEIEVFYSRIRNYTPQLSRSMLLGYIMAHEIAHALEGIARHASTGVMKAEWDFQDAREIRSGILGFEASDVELIRAGMEKRMNDGRLAQLRALREVVR